MEGRKLNLYAPLPSIRRISTKKEHSSEPENKKTTITRPELRSSPSTKQETPVFVLPDQSFDHLTEPASVPFKWEQFPGKPKDDMATLIQESGLLETDEEEDGDLDTISSNGTFSVSCSTSGVSKIDKNGEKSDGGVSRESFDLMMSRFLPAAKVMAFTHQKHQFSSSSSYNSSEQKLTIQNKETLVIRQRSQLVAEQEHFAIIQSLYDDLNTDDDDDDDDDDGHGSFDHRIYPDVTKKACGFLPRLCAKNSFKIISPVSLDSGSNRDLKHSGHQTALPNWSTRRLSGFISPYRTSCSETGYLGAPEKPESFKRRLNRGISKSQELYPPRTRREILPVYSNSGEIRMFRNSISTPPRIQRTTAPDSRFLVEEVNRRRNKPGNILKSSTEFTAKISPPPLPETPSRPWLRRTLLPPVNPRSYGVVLGQVGTKKLDHEVLDESTKWETIVKTSYVHNDHVRYSQELIVHPSHQHNTVKCN